MSSAVVEIRDKPQLHMSEPLSFVLSMIDREARIDALSVVRIDDLDTEFDLKLLHASYDDVIRFMEVANTGKRGYEMVIRTFVPTSTTAFECSFPSVLGRKCAR